MGLQSIMRRGLIAASLASIGVMTGCISSSKRTADAPPSGNPFAELNAQVVKTFSPEKTAPQVSEFECLWQNRLSQLPDPTRNGSMTPGIVGQVFLFGTGYKPATIHGELTVIVNDVTPRPSGLPAAKPEVWHFTAATLKNMVTVDERFGPSYVVFLPWPPEWRDVNALSIQARYDQPGGHTVYSRLANLTLDFSAPGGPTTTGGRVTANGGSGSVPDPSQLLKQVRDGNSSPVQQASYIPPPAVQEQMQPVPEYKRTVIPR